ncbi:hypothetical protein JL721_10777 [Aureococcus anophagefferens]|nr:hypothetical protein JL721_10777 [Aureococcus anophagefferens]
MVKFAVKPRGRAAPAGEGLGAEALASELAAVKRQKRALQRQLAGHVKLAHMAAVTSHAEARTFCATIFGNALYEDRLPPRFLVASYVGVDPDRPRGPYPPSLLRLHPARDHALGTPATRLDLAPWRADEPQLRRIVAAVGPTLVDLDLAPASTTATSRRRGPARRRRRGDARPERRPAAARLRRLGLAVCAVTTAGVAGVVHATLHSLEALDLAENPQLDEAVVLALRDPLRPARLATIDLSGLAALGDGGVAVVVRCCPGLEVVRLCGCGRVGDEGARLLVDGCPGLRDLRLASCARVDGSFLAHDVVAPRDPKQVEGEIACLAMRPALTALDLGDTAARRECARWAAGCCPALRALRLATCGPLEDEGLLALAVNPALALESLDVSGCHLLGRDGGKAFYELAYRHGDSLECLDLRHVPLLAPHVVAQILDDCTFLRQLRLDGTQAPSEACFGGAEGAELALAQAKEGLRAAAFRPSGGVGAPVSLLGGKGSGKRRRPPERPAAAHRERPVRTARLGALEELTMAGCARLTAPALAWVATRLPNVRCLDLTRGRRRRLADASVWCVASSCPRLRRLLIARPQDSGGMSRNAAANSAFLTDASLYAIGEHLPRLETLDLSQHPFLTALGWAGFENPRLRVLKMTGCAALEPEDVRRVFGANAYATSHEGDVAIRPNRDAAAIERRDAAYARLHHEGLCATWIFCGWRFFQLTHRIRRRIAGAVVKRAVVEYRARRRDAFRQHFKRLVNYRRIIARWSAIRLQRGRREIGRGGGNRSRAAEELEDAMSRRILDEIGGHVARLAENMATTKRQMGETMQTKQDRLRKGVQERLKAAELSIPLSRKMRVPVYGDARPHAYDGAAAAAGRSHVFGEAVWPEPRGRVFEETVADFDPKAATYEARAKMVEKTAAAALSGGELEPELGKGGDSKDADYADGKAEQSRRTPWSMANLQSADSLLPTLAAANLAQMKQTLILDRAKNETEARQIEEAKRLEQALEEAEEEARQQAAAAALVSEEENQAVTDMCALVRGHFGRTIADQARENRATMLEEREKARVGKAATAIQKLERALSVRRDFDDRDIGVGTCCGLREVVQEEYAVVEYGEPPQPSLVSRRGRGRHAPGSEGEQENKAKIQIRVHADFQIRRSYERKAALFERGELRSKCAAIDEKGLVKAYERLEALDAEHDKLADLELANDCVGKALQAMIVAYLSAESEKTQAPAKVPEAWDVAMRGVAARRKHLTYAVDALEKAQWWGVEAVRCHYRRHRACALSMSTAANRLRWLDRECALIGKLRAFLRQRREMAPDSIHQKYYVAWLDSQLERLASMFVALDSEQEHVVARDLGQMRACMETALGSEAILDEMVQDLRADYKYDAEKVGLELARLRMDAESEDALRALEATTVLKQKQEHLHEGAFVQLRAALEDLHKREESRLERQIAFRGDEQGLEREKLVDIQAVLRNPPKIHGHFDQEKWLDVFRSQPWLAQQEKREDMVKESAELDALEAAMLENERVRDAADSTRDAREAAATFLEVNAGVLAEKRADHARREEALEKLEGTLAEFTREMGAEEKEAHDRLAAARAAKAEFDATESEEEDKRAAVLNARKRAIAAEMSLIEQEMAADDGDDADAIDAMEERSKGLEEELEAIDRELKSMKERSDRRKVMTEAVEAEATEEVEAKAQKELQEKLSADKKSEAVEKMREQARKDEEQAAKEEAALQLEREQAAELKAAGALAAMGLVAAEQQESNHMMQSIMRRQKLKMGAATAIRSIRFTVGKEETDAFKEKQEQFAADSLPHYIRVKKTIGLHTQIAIWIEPSADQDEFLTDVQIAHSSPENEFYKDLSQRGYAAYTHPKLQAEKGSDPGFVIWGKKRKDAVFVVASIEVSYTLRDEQNFAADGYEKIDKNLTNFNFGDMFLWVKKINRNAEAENDNEESIFHELRATRKEIRKRPDDPILVQREKGLKARLEKVKEYADYRDAFKEDPLKYAIEFMAITQSELERWMDHFTAMDTEHIGGISPKQVLEYLGFRDTRFMYAAFALLGEPADGTLMDFGETVKCIGSFCFFGKDELLHFAYSIFDSDDNGYITHDEFLLLLSDLHAATNRGRTNRALREIELFDDGKLTYEEFLETDKNFPNLFYPLFEAQNLMRQKFFGTRYWTRKLQKYTKIKAQLREERQNNTDKMAAADAWFESRVAKRTERLHKSKLAAQNTQSIVKRSLLTARIYALQFAQKHDKKKKKFGRVNKNLPGAIK